MTDVLQLLGKPSSRMKTPSALVSQLYKREGEEQAKNAKTIWSYNYFQKKEPTDKFKTLKYLVLFFNETDTLVSKIYFEPKVVR